MAASNKRDHATRSRAASLLLVHITYSMDVIFCAHLIHGELHIQHNANREATKDIFSKANHLKVYIA